MYIAHVAACKHAGDIGASLLVGEYGAAVHLNAYVLQPQTCGGGTASDGEQYLVRLHGFGFAVKLVNNALVGNGGNLCAQQEGYALLFVVLLQNLAYVSVGGAGYFVHHLNNRDLAAGRAEVAGHLQAYNAASDDHKTLRNGLQIQDLAVCKHKAGGQVFFKAGDGGNRRFAAAGNEQACAFIHGVAHGNAEFGAGALFDMSLAVHNGDLVGLQTHFDAAHKGVHDLALSGDHLGVVQLDVFNGDAVFLAVSGAVIQLGGVKQGLGTQPSLRQTPPIKRFSISRVLSPAAPARSEAR